MVRQLFLYILLLNEITVFAGSEINSKKDWAGADSTICGRKKEIIKNIMNMPIAFRPNLGQWENKILYQASSENGTIYFMNNCLSFAHRRDINNNTNCGTGRTESKDYEVLVWNIHLEGTNSNIQISPSGKKTSVSNYFTGGKQITKVPDYSEILYREIYENIDLRFYNAGKDLEYDYILKPGADINKIKRTAEGTEKISINKSGDIEFTNKWGIIKERKPYAYQIINGKISEVIVQFSLINNKTYGFKIISKYDPSFELIIDPVILKWSTFVGGTGGNGSGNINDLGLAGNFPSVIVGTGYYNDTYPTTAGVYDQTYNGGEDVFVFQLNGTGTAFDWVTYVGGPGNDRGQGIIVKPGFPAINSLIYVSGYTSSPAFPTTAGVIGPAYKGGGTDAICFQLNGDGSIMNWSTFLGGSGDDYGMEMKLDGGGLPYYTGYTNSTDFPATALAFDITSNGGFDAFFTELNVVGTALVYSSYIGGTNDDYGYGISFETFGVDYIYIVGSTRSNNFPVSPGAFDTGFNGSMDAFVFAFDGPALPYPRAYATYLGGAGDDYATSCVAKFDNEVLLDGYTNSAAFPTTPGVFDISWNGGYDVFVTKMNATGTGLKYSTFVGGSGDDYGEDIVYKMGMMDDPIVAGTTTSTDFPTTCQAYDQSYNGGMSDNFLFKLDAANNVNKLLYSSYFGGSNKDYNACLYSDYSLSSMGCEGVLMGFNSHSFDYPTTAGVVQPSKLNEGTPGLNPQPGVLLLQSAPRTNNNFSVAPDNCSLTLTFSPLCTEWSFDGPFTFWSWDFGDGNFASTENPSHTYAAAGTYTITLSAFPGCGSNTSQTIHIGSPPSITTANISPACFGGNNGSASAIPSGGTPGYTYSWNNASTGQTNTGLIQGTYTVTVTDNNGCSKTASTSLTQPPATTASVAAGTISCFGGKTTATVTAGGGTPGYTYNWNPSGQTTVIATALAQGDYTVTVTDSKGCTSTSTTSITQPVASTASITPGTINCFGGTTTATVTVGGGTPAYTYNWSATGGSGQTTSTASGLTAGNYTVTVIDTKGCTSTATTAIISPPPLSGQFTKGATSCADCGCKEWILINATGGTSPYSYSWPDGYLNRYKNHLCPGSYSINIKDKNGCSVNVNLTAP